MKIFSVLVLIFVSGSSLAIEKAMTIDVKEHHRLIDGILVKMEQEPDNLVLHLEIAKSYFVTGQFELARRHVSYVLDNELPVNVRTNAVRFMTMIEDELAKKKAAEKGRSDWFGSVKFSADNRWEDQQHAFKFNIFSGFTKFFNHWYWQPGVNLFAKYNHDRNQLASNIEPTKFDTFRITSPEWNEYSISLRQTLGLYGRNWSISVPHSYIYYKKIANKDEKKLYNVVDKDRNISIRHEIDLIDNGFHELTISPSITFLNTYTLGVYYRQFDWFDNEVENFDSYDLTFKGRVKGKGENWQGSIESGYKLLDYALASRTQKMHCMVVSADDPEAVKAIEAGNKACLFRETILQNTEEAFIQGKIDYSWNRITFLAEGRYGYNHYHRILLPQGTDQKYIAEQYNKFDVKLGLNFDVSDNWVLSASHKYTTSFLPSSFEDKARETVKLSEAQIREEQDLYQYERNVTEISLEYKF